MKDVGSCGIFYVIETSPYDTKTLRGIALRRSGRVSLKRPAAGGESCKQDSFYMIGDLDDMIRLKTAFHVQKTVYFINKPKIP